MTPILAALLPPSVHTFGLTGILCDQLTEKEKKVPALQTVLHDMLALARSGLSSRAARSFLKTTRVNPPNGQNFKNYARFSILSG